MRNRTAKDALARWMVLTAAGAGLVVLFPPAAFGGPSSAEPVASAVHFVPVIAASVVVAAWVVFHLHVAQLRISWHRDAAALALMVVGSLGAVATVVAIALNSLPVLLAALAASAFLHLALACRIDRLRHGRVSPVGVPAGTVPS